MNRKDRRQMLAIALLLLLPIVLIPISKKIHKDRQMSKGEGILRYLIYFIAMCFLSTVILNLMSDDEVSFVVKANQSLTYAIKVVCLQIALMIGIAGAEWLYAVKRITEKVNLQEILEKKSVCFVRKYVCPLLIYVTALLVIFLNFRLMFDNVVCGEEAFLTNMIKVDMGDMFRVFYSGEMQPPLYYYCLKLFGELFGHTVPVYHLASLVPFAGGMILAVTKLRKHFGNLSAVIFIIIAGLGFDSLKYNLEIGMCAMAFLAVTFSFYCAYQVIRTDKKAAWIGMVLWALIAAYTHYYAMITTGILLFCTGIGVWLKYRRKAWVKGLTAIIVFLIGCTPWLTFLVTNINDVPDSWWITKQLSLQESLNIVMGGVGMSKLVFPLFGLLVAILLLAQSSIFRFEDKDGKQMIQLNKPTVRNWSDETYLVVIGLFTIAGALIFSYILCFIKGPLLVDSYLYILSGITVITLVAGSSRVITLIQELGSRVQQEWMKIAGKAVLVLFLLIFIVIGADNYDKYSFSVKAEYLKTGLTLKLIEEPEEDVQLVANELEQLENVLQHYYPDNEIISGDYKSADADKVWYFTSQTLGDRAYAELTEAGYSISQYGGMNLSTYWFHLYYMEKSEIEKME